MSIIHPDKLSIEDYHRAAWLTHSKLQTFDRGGPRLYYLAHVQQLWPARPDSDALKFGKALELLAFHPKQFEAAYVIRPPTKNADGTPNKEGDARYTEGKAWKKAHEQYEKDGFVLDAAEAAAMYEMVAALKENETAMALLAACEEQLTYTATWEAGNGMRLDVASRMDFSSAKGCAVTGFAPFLLDLKTTDRLLRFRSGNVIAEYGYHSQMALGQWTMGQNLPNLPTPRGLQVVIEKQLPHRCEIFELDEPSLDVGFAWNTYQVDMIATHHAANEWPRVNNSIQKVGIPAYAARIWSDEIPE